MYKILIPYALFLLSSCTYPTMQVKNFNEKNILKPFEVESVRVSFTKDIEDLRVTTTSIGDGVIQFELNKNEHSEETEGLLICASQQFEYKLRELNIPIKPEGELFTFEFDKFYVKNIKEKEINLFSSIKEKENNLFSSYGLARNEEKITEEFVTNINIYRKGQLISRPSFKRIFYSDHLNNCSLFIDEVISTIISK